MIISRRKFLKTSALATLAAGCGPTLIDSGTGMPYRILGRTGEKVSLLSLGGAHIGGIGPLDDGQAIALMRTAIDDGITFFDNAWGYSDGLSEERMGKALQNGYRNKVFLMSKVPSRDPAVLLGQLDQSLKRLQTDYLDLWQFHGIQTPDDVDKIYDHGLLDLALKAKGQGKIRYIGFTGHAQPALHVEMIERGFAWDTIQMPVNLFDPHYLSFIEAVLPLAVAKDIGVIAMKTMAGSPGTIPATGAATAGQCLRYAMSLPVSTVCSGMEDIHQLRHNIDVAKTFRALPAGQLAALVESTEAIADGGKHESYKAGKQ